MKDAVIWSGGLLDVERESDIKKRAKVFSNDQKRIRERFMAKVTQDTRRMLYLCGIF